MYDLFDAIVELLLTVCRHTGLRYAEINILIYCGIIPLSWAMVLGFRQRKYWWIPLLHLGLVLYYLKSRQGYTGYSQQFYDANIAALQWGAAYGPGYVGISILTGVLFPVMIYGLLITAAKRWVLYVYLMLLAGNLAYYAWVLSWFYHQPEH